MATLWASIPTDNAFQAADTGLVAAALVATVRTGSGP
jgi:hypothetical protein